MDDYKSKDEIYEKQLYPLLSEVERICAENGMAVLVSIGLDPGEGNKVNMAGLANLGEETGRPSFMLAAAAMLSIPGFDWEVVYQLMRENMPDWLNISIKHDGVTLQ